MKTSNFGSKNPNSGRETANPGCKNPNFGTENPKFWAQKSQFWDKKPQTLCLKIPILGQKPPNSGWEQTQRCLQPPKPPIFSTKSPVYSFFCPLPAGFRGDSRPFWGSPDHAELEVVVAAALDDRGVAHLHRRGVGARQEFLLLDGFLHRLGQLAVPHFLRGDVTVTSRWHHGNGDGKPAPKRPILGEKRPQNVGVWGFIRFLI